MATQPQQENQAKSKKRRLNVFPASNAHKNGYLSEEELHETSTQEVLPSSSLSDEIMPNSLMAPPEVLGQTTGEFAVSLIDRYLSKMISYEEDVLQDRDPEPLHQMRVQGRRLRSVVELLLPVLNIPKKGQVKRLEAFHRILGRVRNCDVVNALLSHNYYPHLPEDEQQRLNTYLDKLKKQRKTGHRKAREAMMGKSFVSAYHQWLSDPQYSLLGQKPIAEILPGLILPEFTKYYHHPAWEITESALTQEKQAQLHYLRKAIKHLRYQLEACQVMYGDLVNGWIESLKATQSTLGVLEDLTLLEGIILPDSMPFAHGMLQEQRQEAWMQWKMQQNTHQCLDQYDYAIMLLQPLRQLNRVCREL